MGKGSTRRPTFVSRQREAENWTRTFGTAAHRNTQHAASQTYSTAVQLIEPRLTVTRGPTHDRSTR